MRDNQNIVFAGRITGVEGYMESAMSGIVAAMGVWRKLQGKPAVCLPPTTMCGALCRYISDVSVTDFQPMGASFGLLPKAETVIKDKKQRYLFLAQRALQDLKAVLANDTE